ncbi:hypothetical protein ACFL27_25230 [candidate division CSSED10-310 bacterium]|uniref:Uncharacterized protein n=1 Tax=candidate division CSSED10-310 bacterium TaxID=2855610 RepID=A0ABV6Z4Y2_UNCC1
MDEAKQAQEKQYSTFHFFSQFWLEATSYKQILVESTTEVNSGYYAVVKPLILNSW